MTRPVANIEEIASVRRDGVTVVVRYVVTCGRFLATLPACGRDECGDGDIAGSLKECTIRPRERGQHPLPGGKTGVDDWLRHVKTHCHNYHRGSVQVFADTVAKTYGSHRPLTPARASVRATVVHRPAWVAEQLGLSLDSYRNELATAWAQ